MKDKIKIMKKIKETKKQFYIKGERDIHRMKGNKINKESKEMIIIQMLKMKKIMNIIQNSLKIQKENQDWLSKKKEMVNIKNITTKDQSKIPNKMVQGLETVEVDMRTSQEKNQKWLIKKFSRMSSD